MTRSSRYLAALAAMALAVIAAPAAGCSSKEPPEAAATEPPAPTTTPTTPTTPTTSTTPPTPPSPTTPPTTPSPTTPPPPPIVGVPAPAIPGHADPQDDTPKEGPRLVPQEVYLQTYVKLFGDDLTPLQVEALARGADAGIVFDRWADYMSPLGFPDHKLDVNRQTNTNTLMMGTFERLGIALCARKAEIELRSSPPPPSIAARRVFAFDMTPADPTDAEFAARFDVLHRTFLGYPAALAPTERAGRFRAVFRDVVRRHAAPGAPTSRFTPQQAGWAVVCYGLVRHPEFIVY
ncbi:hypothetical protein WME89_37565 [Sorangium sp. So ce321]|uniref:hypothetical protein n=1 Tax=Sorangium sp. So ce321 TaxID=3133300 RepID=UPI003F60C7B9